MQKEEQMIEKYDDGEYLWKIIQELENHCETGETSQKIEKNTLETPKAETSQKTEENTLETPKAEQTDKVANNDVEFEVDVSAKLKIFSLI